ncbi:MAG: pyridoxamine kinase [Ruminococcaceae bacterium]|nr:pyridoxamine kinase [Oscillospiraceae bacterium]
MIPQKRAVTINDISGMGRCSVTVACPVLSAAGIETSVLPTALLSTHTGGFSEYSFLDLTDEMSKIMKHWQSLGRTFDAIYSGYLGSVAQIEKVNEFIDIFKDDNTFIMVDPVMGDAGRFYAGFTEEYIDGMRKLCGRADIIVPNITEALFLLNKEYKDGPYTEEYIKEIMKEISSFGCKRIVLTGVCFDNENVGASCFDAENGAFSTFLAPRIEGFYHGTGDVFASTLLSALLNNKTLAESTKIAVDFTEDSIIRTRNAKTDTRYGVIFEQELPALVRKLGL